MKLIFALSLTLAASAAFAHHGSTGQFNHDIELDVSGVVTDIRYVNPHSYVYFDVTNDAGGVDPWRCEMRAGSLLKRSGWTEEMFADGTEISIHGSAARREEFGCYTNTITFADGRVIQRIVGMHYRFWFACGTGGVHHGQIMLVIHIHDGLGNVIIRSNSLVVDHILR